jgi:phosphoribosylglycinamide formyltransferase-1
MAHPAQAFSASKGNLKHHRLGLAGKALELATPDGGMPHGNQAGREPLGITQNGWQDGEVGHGAMPAFSDPSDQESSVQWPLPPDGQPAHPPLRLGVMASGSGSNFEALVQACRDGTLRAEVALLVVNNPGCGAQQRAERLGVPCQLHDHRTQPSREQLDAALVEAFHGAAVDLVVMAGWMRVVTPTLIGAFAERLVNIHPSLLPSFRGLDAVGQALAAGVTLTGCTAHLVCEEVDAGRILVQAAVPVLSDDDHASLSARIQRQEHRILPLAVALTAQRLAAQG